MAKGYKHFLLVVLTGISISACAQNEDTLPAPGQTISLKPGKILTCYVKKTAAAVYGGGIYCEYSTVLQDIRMWLQFSEDKSTIIGATVVFLAKETQASSCKYEGFKPTNHYYRLKKPVPVQNGYLIWDMELTGNPGNRPACSLLFSGKMQDGVVSGTLRLHRTDQKPPLDYSFVIPMELN